MVNSVTNLGRSGVYDWVIQRLSAVIMAVYTLFLLGFVLATPDLTYDAWKDLFSCTSMKVFTFATLISICAHAWVGLWTKQIFPCFVGQVRSGQNKAQQK